MRGAAALRIQNYAVTPVARFQVVGRVLGARHYRTDREADQAALDLAMGWGPMANPAVLKSIEITQDGRFYHWHVAAFPIPASEITQHSANMHLIPATPQVAAQIPAVEQGQEIRFKGYLVKIAADDGWRWPRRNRPTLRHFQGNSDRLSRPCDVHEMRLSVALGSRAYPSEFNAVGPTSSSIRAIPRSNTLEYFLNFVA